MGIDEGGGKAEAEQWCQIAGRLLEARDLVGCKRFAEWSMEADPLVEGVDQIVAAADVLLASQWRINSHLDCYSILQLQPTPDGIDYVAIRSAYPRLALFLHPDRNGHLSAALAFKLVSEAWAFLSDPNKKRIYDDEIKIAVHVGSNDQEEPTGDTQRQQSSPPPPASLWTMCSECFRAYEFAKEYENRTLLCQNCRKVFRATELPTTPPVVPGTDMYYCSWGLFPLGFPSAPLFNGVVILEGTVCIPTFPGDSANQPPGRGQGGTDVGWQNASGKRNSIDSNPNRVVTRRREAASATPSVATRTAGRKPRKALASKPKKQDSAQQPPPQAQLQQQTGIMFGVQNNNAQGTKNDGVPTTQHNDSGGGIDMNSFSIDLDHTAEVLGNLADFPFLKDDEIVVMR